MLEGGSIDVNGAGSLLTTEECLLSDVQARNPGAVPRRLRSGLSRLSRCASAYLAEATGLPATIRMATSTIWRALSIRIRSSCGRRRIRSDPNYGPLQENLELLQA